MKVVIKKSTNKDKKYMAIFYDDNDKKIKTTHFGSAGSSDFIKSGGDEKKKKAYLDRHRVNENWNDYKSAGSLSRWILWNKKTLSASIADYKNRFNLN
jgi:hypothetical protein